MAVESTTEAIVVNDAVLSMLQLLRLLLLAASRPRPQPDEINHDLFCVVSLAARRLIKYAPPGWRPCPLPLPGRSRPRQRLRPAQEGQQPSIARFAI